MSESIENNNKHSLTALDKTQQNLTKLLLKRKVDKLIGVTGPGYLASCVVLLKDLSNNRQSAIYEAFKYSNVSER